MAPTEEQLSRRVAGTHKIAAAAHDFPPPLVEHSGLEPVFGDRADGGDRKTTNMWVVHGMFPMLPYVLTMPVTMCIYRDAAGALTIFNAIRVSEEVEDAILALGPVANVVKLGQFHGKADAYYVCASKFGSPKLWLLPGATYADGMPADRMETLSSNHLPIGGSELYVLKGMPYVECVIVVPDQAHGSTLVTTDSLVHISGTAGLPLIARLFVRMLFYVRPNVPQPAALWFKHAVAFNSKDVVRGWYDDIFELSFRHIVTGHGTAVLDVSRERMSELVNEKLAPY